MSAILTRAKIEEPVMMLSMDIRVPASLVTQETTVTKANENCQISLQ